MITLKPWEFPLATAESRAAARAMIENREEDSRRRRANLARRASVARSRAGAAKLEQSAFCRTLGRMRRWNTLPDCVYTRSLGEGPPRRPGPGLPRVWDALQYKDARSS